jgi:hypothetical protein
MSTLPVDDAKRKGDGRVRGCEKVLAVCDNGAVEEKRRAESDRQTIGKMANLPIEKCLNWICRSAHRKTKSVWAASWRWLLRSWELEAESFASNRRIAKSQLWRVAVRLAGAGAATMEAGQPHLARLPRDLV